MDTPQKRLGKLRSEIECVDDLLRYTSEDLASHESGSNAWRHLVLARTALMQARANLLATKHEVGVEVATAVVENDGRPMPRFADAERNTFVETFRKGCAEHRIGERS